MLFAQKRSDEYLWGNMYMFYLHVLNKVYSNPNFFAQLMHFKICEIVYSAHLNKEYF